MNIKTVDEARNRIRELESLMHAINEKLLSLKKYINSSDDASAKDSLHQSANFNVALEREKVMFQIDEQQKELDKLEQEKDSLDFFIQADKAKYEHPGYKKMVEMANNSYLHSAMQEYWKKFAEPKVKVQTVYEKVRVKKKSFIFESYEDIVIEKKVEEKLLFELVKRENDEIKAYYSQADILPDKWSIILSTYLGEVISYHSAEDGTSQTSGYLCVLVIWRNRETKMEHYNHYIHSYSSDENRKAGLAFEILGVSKPSGENVFYSLDEICSFIARAIVRENVIHSSDNRY